MQIVSDLREIEPIEPPSVQVRQKIQKPPEIALAAYRVQVLLGAKQVDIAKTIEQEFHQPVSQGQVSRWLKQVEEYVEAGNVLPDLPPRATKPESVDPRFIEMGRRRAGNTKRQRHRSSDETYDGSDDFTD